MALAGLKFQQIPQTKLIIQDTSAWIDQALHILKDALLVLDAPLQIADRTIVPSPNGDGLPDRLKNHDLSLQHVGGCARANAGHAKGTTTLGTNYLVARAKAAAMKTWRVRARACA